MTGLVAVFLGSGCFNCTALNLSLAFDFGLGRLREAHSKKHGKRLQRTGVIHLLSFMFPLVYCIWQALYPAGFLQPFPCKVSVRVARHCSILAGQLVTQRKLFISLGEGEVGRILAPWREREARAQQRTAFLLQLSIQTRCLILGVYLADTYW